MKRRIAVAALALTVAATVQAQSVQRCESPDRKVTYANGPCPDGTAPVRALPDPAPPNDSDQKAATERAARDARRLQQIERVRASEAAKTAAAAERATELAQARAQRKAEQCRKLEERAREAREDLAAATLAQRPERERRLKRAESAFAYTCGSAGR